MSTPAPTPETTPTPRRRLGRRLAFSVATAVAFAGAIELAARLFLPRAAIPALIAPMSNIRTPEEFFRPHPTLFWELVPDLDVFDPHWGDVTNSDGLRMRREVGPKDGRLRVACFGDSCTYGLDVPVDDAWPNMLDKDGALDVINAGMPGYSSYQGALLADMRCPAWKPDVVVVEFGNNDVVSWMQFDRGEVVALTDEERAPHVRIDHLARKSVALGWIASSLAPPPPPRAVPRALLEETRAPRDAPDPEYASNVLLMMQGHERLPARVTPSQLRANILRIAAHAPYAVVLLWPRRRVLDPSMKDSMSKERLAPYVEAIGSVASERIDVVNLAEPLVASRLTAEQAFTDPVHGTRALSALVAGVVREKIRGRLGR
jgi:lysophospholipase L1-like esterase